MMVDYREREERLREKRKNVCMYVSPLHHHLRSITEEKKYYEKC